MARPKKQLNRRENIIEAAQNLFEQKGFENTTIDEIAKSVGIGKGSVYLEFKNKEEILKAIADRFTSIMLEKQESRIDNAQTPYLKLYKEIQLSNISEIFDIAHSYIHTYIAQMNTSYKMKQSSEDILQRFMVNNALLLKKSQDNGEMKPYDDNIYLANLIFTALQAFHPPYDFKYSPYTRTDLNKEQVRELILKDASDILEFMLSGLKMTNNTDNI